MKVKCLDPCLNVYPKRKGINIHSLPNIIVGDEYTVKEKIEIKGKEYYRFNELPYDHVFDVRGFVEL